MQARFNFLTTRNSNPILDIYKEASTETSTETSTTGYREWGRSPISLRTGKSF